MTSPQQIYSIIPDKGVLKDIFHSGGPIPSDYEYLTLLASSLLDTHSFQRETIADLLTFIQKSDCMIGHTFQKPYGYAGDFNLIEKIYKKSVTRNIHFSKWDMFYQQTDSAKAVRNRKKYLVKEITKVSTKHKTPLLLNIGSGPCTELLEYLNNPFTKNNFFVDCVDLDSKAIQFASQKLKKYPQNINFINKNILRFKTLNRYNLIWSAGLFDYLDDRHFVTTTKKLYSQLLPDGELVIGNFNEKNPSRGLMEVFCDWVINS